MKSVCLADALGSSDRTSSTWLMWLTSRGWQGLIPSYKLKRKTVLVKLTHFPNPL